MDLEIFSEEDGRVAHIYKKSFTRGVEIERSAGVGDDQHRRRTVWFDLCFRRSVTIISTNNGAVLSSQRHSNQIRLRMEIDKLESVEEAAAAISPALTTFEIPTCIHQSVYRDFAAIAGDVAKNVLPASEIVNMSGPVVVAVEIVVVTLKSLDPAAVAELVPATTSAVEELPVEEILYIVLARLVEMSDVAELPMLDAVDEILSGVLSRLFEVADVAVFVAASSSAIEELPAVDAAQEGDLCSICREEFAVGEKVAGLPCSHVYHRDCITNWLKISHVCPLCRYPMPPQT